MEAEVSAARAGVDASEFGVGGSGPVDGGSDGCLVPRVVSTALVGLDMAAGDSGPLAPSASACPC